MYNFMYDFIDHFPSFRKITIFFRRYFLLNQNVKTLIWQGMVGLVDCKNNLVDPYLCFRAFYIFLIDIIAIFGIRDVLFENKYAKNT